MNNTCMGEHYKYCGKIFYRCLYDGTTIDAKKIKTSICPNCGRTIYVPPYDENMEEAQSQVQVVTTTTILVVDKNGDWIPHKKDLIRTILN